MHRRRLPALAAALLAVAALASGCAIAVPEGAAPIDKTNARLNAKLYTTFGGPVTYWFRYGRTTSYGSETPRRTIVLEPNTGQAVSELAVNSIFGLTPGTEYHWQVCAQDTEESPPRTNCSADRTFVTHNVACGETVTRSVVLTNDLGDCGFTIGAAGITVDLNGHTVGPIVNNGFDDVTIENGTVRGGDGYGVSLTDAADNTVRDITLEESFNGISVAGDSAGTTIADNTARVLWVALRLSASGLEVLRNDLSGDGSVGSGGNKQSPVLVSGDDNRLEGNRAALDFGAGHGVGGSSIGVSGDDNEIVGNTISDSIVHGLGVASVATGTVITDNVVERNGLEFGVGHGIAVESASTSIGGNRANGNGELGISAPAGVTDLGGNRASGNGDTRQCTGVVCHP